MNRNINNIYIFTENLNVPYFKHKKSLGIMMFWKNIYIYIYIYKY